MKKDNTYYHALLAQFLDNQLPTKEVSELLDWINEDPVAYQAVLDSPALQEQLLRYGAQYKVPFVISDSMRIKLLGVISLQEHQTVARGRFLQQSWWSYAAILMLIAGAAIYWLVGYRSENLMPNAPLVTEIDLPPGGNKAILTLADGSNIVLDSAAKGVLAQQGNTKIVKLEAGSLAYQAQATQGEILYNTISTPRGGVYQVALPDGSKVWLNAASSIRFPTAFDKDRTVTITGEAYFEIVADKKKPFFVNALHTQIQVLGTSFNVNAYSDQPAVKTALLEGRVKIGATVLEPGQAYKAGKLVVTNIEQDLAWKNGLFNFSGQSLQEVMRQLERWYDIEVVYEGAIPNITFGGEMTKGVTLKGLLILLEKVGGHYQLDGRKLLVRSRESGR